MDLIPNTPRRRGRPADNVLRVTIFTRKGSRYFQASIKMGRFWKRVTTRTMLRAAAKEFAEAAYRQYARDLHNPPPTAPSAPVQEELF